MWVLSSAYRFTRAEIVDALAAPVRARSVVFTSNDQLARALDAFRRGKGDFADYLIREHARAAGVEAVATFDRALLAEKGYTSP